VEVGRFVELQGGQHQFPVLVDLREGDHTGVILQHPLFDKLIHAQGRLPESFKDYRVTPGDLPDEEHPRRQQDYRDPLAADAEGRQYRRRWLAGMEKVRVQGRETGLVVIVQEVYGEAIGSTLDRLKRGLIRYGQIALVMVALVLIGLWRFAGRMSTQ
jgi:hypothetical protein